MLSVSNPHVWEGGILLYDLRFIASCVPSCFPSGIYRKIPSSMFPRSTTQMGIVSCTLVHCITLSAFSLLNHDNSAGHWLPPAPSPALRPFHGACRRHWEDHDWTDTPSRPWTMPPGFVEWLVAEERRQAAQLAKGEDSSKGAAIIPGTASAAAQRVTDKMAALANIVPSSPFAASPTNAASKATQARLAAAAITASKPPTRPAGPAGPRAPRPESASSLLDRMLGSAALPPAPTPRPAPAPVVLAPRVAPGAPTAGGMGIKRPRCLSKGCTNAVSGEMVFCSVDCTVAAQKQACQALLDYHQKLQSSSAARMTTGRIPKLPGVVSATNGVNAAAAAAAPDGSGGGGAGAAGGGSSDCKPAAGGGGGAAAAAAGVNRTQDSSKSDQDKSAVVSSSSSSVPSGSPGAAPWTAQDEEEFSKGLEAVRARSVLTPAMRFRLKVRDRFRELFAEGMSALGVGDGEEGGSSEVAVMAGVLAWDLEHELNVFSRSDRGKYKEKAQSLRFNVKFAKNPELFKVQDWKSVFFFFS